MIIARLLVVFAAWIPVACGAVAAADGILRAVTEPIAFPIQVAAGSHTFTDAKGQPFFWLGTTQWELFRGYSLEDARIILEKSARERLQRGAGQAAWAGRWEPAQR